MEGNDETLAKEKEGFVVDEEHIFGGNLERPIVQATMLVGTRPSQVPIFSPRPT